PCRPAGHDAVRRRSPARQTGEGTEQARDGAHALHPGRADHRAAFPRREEAIGGAARAGVAGQHRGRDRAQSRGDQDRGLGDRPWPRRRRRRRRNRRLGSAGRHRESAEELHRQVSGAGAGAGERRKKEARGERGGGVRMYGLPKTVPDVEVLLALSPEELAGEILIQVRGRFGKAQFHPGNLKNELGSNIHGNQPQYPANRIDDARLALSEAWAWLENNGLIVPPLNDTNASAGWRVLSRQGLQFERKENFESFLKARQLPKSMLHPDMTAQRSAIRHFQIALCPLQRLDRGLFVDADDDRVLRRGHVEPNYVGRLGGELRIAALAPGFAPSEVDLLGTQEAPDILHIDIAERCGQERSRPAGIALGLRLIQQRQNAFARFRRVFWLFALTLEGPLDKSNGRRNLPSEFIH